MGVRARGVLEVPARDGVLEEQRRLRPGGDGAALEVLGSHLGFLLGEAFTTRGGLLFFQANKLPCTLLQTFATQFHLELS